MKGRDGGIYSRAAVACIQCRGLAAIDRLHIMHPNALEDNVCIVDACIPYHTDLPRLRQSLQAQSQLNACDMYQLIAASFRADSKYRIQTKPHYGWLTGRMLVSFERPFGKALGCRHRIVAKGAHAVIGTDLVCLC